MLNLGLIVQGSTMYINSTGNSSTVNIIKCNQKQIREFIKFSDELNFIDEINLEFIDLDNIANQEEQNFNYNKPIKLYSELLQTNEDNNLEISIREKLDNSNSYLASPSDLCNLIPQLTVPIANSNTNLTNNHQSNLIGEDNINQLPKMFNFNPNIIMKFNTEKSEIDIEKPKIEQEAKGNELNFKTSKTTYDYFNQISIFTQSAQKISKNEMKIIPNTFTFLNPETQKHTEKQNELPEAKIEKIKSIDINQNPKFIDKESSYSKNDKNDNFQLKTSPENNSEKQPTTKQNIYSITIPIPKEMKTVPKLEETIIRFIKPKDFADVTFKIINNLPANSISNARISLNPPSLGKIMIAIRLINDNLSLNIKVENKDIFKLIENQIPYLKDKLQLTGIKIENLEFNSNNDKTVEYQNNNYSSQQKNQKENLMREFLKTFRQFNINAPENNTLEAGNKSMFINNQQVK